MRIIKLPYTSVPLCANRDVKYIEEVDALQPFYKYKVNLDSFVNVIEDKAKEPIDRKALVESIKRQHSLVASSSIVDDNIEKLLLANTFTIVTAHQPSLFTGPLFYIFKIVSTINLAKKLSSAYPNYNFVPVFIISGEDHDFAEVNHLNLYGKRIEWQSGETGAVGNMGTASLEKTFEDLKSVLGSGELATQVFEKIVAIHQKHTIYIDAAFEMVHELFKDHGLVVLNPNDAALKKVFTAIIKEEVLQQPSQKLVNQTIEQLEKAGFPSQANPREINFFYLGEQFRERIVEDDGIFRILNTELRFTREEMEVEIQQHPERFSPNVVMRPIYQEKILPNLAYVGGGGELAYWLERKTQFEHFGINFPMLVRRNSAMWIDAASSKKMEKLGINLEDIWMDTNEIVRHYLHQNATEEISLSSYQEELKSVFEKIAQKATNIDTTLISTVWAEHSKVSKGVEQLEARLLKAEKAKNETAIQQIQNLKEKLFPGGGLQERHENFIQLYLKHGQEFFNALFESFDPLEKRFIVIID